MKHEHALALALAAGLFLTGAAVAIERSLEWLLVENARATGTGWAQVLEQRLADEPSLDGALSSSGGHHDHAELEALLLGVSRAANIFQIDLINAECHCAISIGSFAAPAVEDAPLLTDRAPLDRIVMNTPGHAPARDPARKDLQFPFDRAQAMAHLEAAETRVFLHTEAPPNQPGIFSEVFHPVYVDGVPNYMLRFLIDQEQIAARYRLFLYAVAAMLIGLAALTAAYPALRYRASRRQQAEADRRIRYLAEHDPLTGILNRPGFLARAQTLLETCADLERPVLLYKIDIRNFKEINDTLGHATGDQILRDLTRMLAGFAPEGGGVLGRLGGDEFALMVCERKLARDRGLGMLDLPDRFEMVTPDRTRIVPVPLVVGVARFPIDGGDIDELQRCADLAHQSAKRIGGPGICVYKASMKEVLRRRNALIRGMRAALRSGRVVPYYQPIVDAGTGRVEGLEALARWIDPEYGVLTPFVFGDAMAEPDIAADLGRAMLAGILNDIARWEEQGVPYRSVSLNVTEADLRHTDFVPTLVASLERTGLPPERLSIEVTENTISGRDKSPLIDALRQLCGRGFRIALDDFGTGYSSILHLKELSFSALKIDKSFIRDLACDHRDRAIVRSLIAMGREIPFRIVGEGVETEEQRSLLDDLGCDLLQGYLFARAVPSAEVPDMIARLNGAGGPANRARGVEHDPGSDPARAEAR